MEAEAFARRAIFKKVGSPDVEVVVEQDLNGGFSIVENGAAASTILRKFSQQQVATGDGPSPITLEDAWQVVRRKLHDYSETNLQDGHRLSKGDYVRLKIAPETRMGTIEDIKIERGRLVYHFRQDERFREAGPLFEAWIPDMELEPCARPSDQHVSAINKLIEMGS
jgi:hypothetical protein